MKFITTFWQKMKNSRPDATETATRNKQRDFRLTELMPNPDPILRKRGDRMKVYEDLLGDDQVGHAAEVIEMAVKAATLIVHNNGASERHTAFMREVMQLWDHDMIVESALRYRLFGYQPFELLWQPGREWIVTDIIGKPAKWFRFDAKNELRLITKDNPQGERVNPWNFHVARHKATYDNPYGQAVLSRTFWPVAFRKGGMKFWLTFIEKYGSPWAIGKQPRGSSPQATDELLDQLDSMIQDAVAVIPDDSSVEIIEAAGKGASSALYLDFERYQDKVIMKTIAGSTLISDDGGGTGSYALGGIHADTTERIIEAVKKQVAALYNSAFKRMTLLNAENEKPPLAMFEKDEDIQEGRARRDEILGRTGVRFKKTYFQNTYNLTKDDFEVPEPAAVPPQLFSSNNCTCAGCRAKAADRHAISHEQGQPAQTDAPEDQQKTDEAIEALTAAGSSHTQAFAIPVVQILRVIEKAQTAEQAFTDLAAAYPELDVNKLEEALTRALFVSQVWGRITAQADD